MQVPECDQSDPAQLAAWYGPFGFCDHWRKIVLSNCREALRAAMALQEIRVTESRLDDLSHIHTAYYEFLGTHLMGRIAYEAEVLKRGFGS